VARFLARCLPPCLPAKTKGLAVASQALDFIGGAKRDRTVDLYNAIVALQPSFSPSRRKLSNCGAFTGASISNRQVDRARDGPERFPRPQHRLYQIVIANRSGCH
jgi:hypothetical protein